MSVGRSERLVGRESELAAFGDWLARAGRGAGGVAWVDEVFEATRGHSTGGVYVNALVDEGPARIRSAYGEATYARLAGVKHHWDPDNVFRLNQNIPPSR
jgi:hypothetical protein